VCHTACKHKERKLKCHTRIVPTGQFKPFVQPPQKSWRAVLSESHCTGNNVAAKPRLSVSSYLQKNASKLPHLITSCAATFQAMPPPFALLSPRPKNPCPPCKGRPLLRRVPSFAIYFSVCITLLSGQVGWSHGVFISP